MNLGQAVAVSLYELVARDPAPQPFQPVPMPESAISGAFPVSGDLDLLAGLVEQAMRAASYSPRSMQQANRHDLRLLLRRLVFTQHDIRRILGLFRRILWKLDRGSQSGPTQE
jgi:tRNA C32,U32 (ribose-2'-O)-methylase TrmJ